MKEGSKACQLTGTFECGFLPPGFTQRLIAAMHKFGRYHRHFGLGGIIMESKISKRKPRRIFLFDLKKCQIYLRVQQLVPEGTGEEDEVLEALVEMVEEMRDTLEGVAGYWRGLGLDFSGDVELNNESMNAQMRRVLASNLSLIHI